MSPAAALVLALVLLILNGLFFLATIVPTTAAFLDQWLALWPIGNFPDLVRTPYGRGVDATGPDFIPQAVARGYAVVVQDVRGRYESKGDYVMTLPVRGALNKWQVDQTTDTTRYRIIGVMPPAFDYPVGAVRTDMWMPIVFSAAETAHNWR